MRGAPDEYTGRLRWPRLGQDVAIVAWPSFLVASVATMVCFGFIDPLLIDYVSAFVSKSSGEHFDPHVTTGIAPLDFLDKMLAEPFESFTFSPAGAAVHQLGQFGTAAKKLHEWGLQR